VLDIGSCGGREVELGGTFGGLTEGGGIGEPDIGGGNWVDAPAGTN